MEAGKKRAVSALISKVYPLGRKSVTTGIKPNGMNHESNASLDQNLAQSYIPTPLSSPQRSRWLSRRASRGFAIDTKTIPSF